MKVLITGVAGFLGSHLADKFLERGDEVVGIDNLIGGYPENVPSGVEFYELDLLDLDKLDMQPVQPMRGFRYSPLA
jgi:UDP-glucose 4-epimerase